MANYGASNPYFALIDTEPENGLPTYKQGVKLAKLISSSDNPTFTTGVLYADDGKAEEVEEFVSATINVSLDDVSIENKARVFGAKVANDNELEYKSTDVAPYGGYAHYVRKMKGNKTRFLGIFYPKVKATQGGVTYNTKGESITFAPDAVTFSASETASYTWKVEVELETEAEALAWVKNKLNITDAAGA
jgi:phi13 family phage major tail protein